MTQSKIPSREHSLAPSVKAESVARPLKYARTNATDSENSANSPVTVRLVHEPAATTPASIVAPFLPSIVALFAIYAVHRLTKGREREKAVFDLYKSTDDILKEIASSAAIVWKTSACSARNAAAETVIWRLHQLGATVEKMRRLSRRRKLIAWPPFRMVEVGATKAMQNLRESITADPFQDPRHGQKASKTVDIQRAIGEFVQDLDQALYGWIDGSAARKPTRPSGWRNFFRARSQA